ncbi:MAG: sialidase, partial [Gemmatimonadales bacterium]
LFEPRSAYRFHNITSPMSMPNDLTSGQNPQYGASINYWLGSGSAGEVEIRVATESGETIRTLEGTTHSGINRVWWNLRDESATRIKLRTKPRYADWVDLGPDRWRSGGGGISVLMPPGRYIVTLAVDGREYTQPLDVLKDPNSEGTEADIAVQIAKVKEIRDDYDVAAGLVNRIEWVRRQIYDLRAVLEDQGGAEEVLTAAEELDVDLIAIEEELLRLTTTGTGQDGVRYPTKLVGRLRYLSGAVATADFRPTDQQGEVHMVLRERLERHRLVVERLLGEDLPRFNQMLQQRNLSPVITDRP